MKKYFKRGIGTIIPIALVFWVLNMFYGWIDSIVVMLLPSSVVYAWWYVFPLTIALFILIELIGFIFSLPPFIWIKKKIETKIVNRVPYIKGIYNFGTELADSFMTDVKGDGEVIIIESGELCKTDGVMIGILMDSKNNLITLPTVPNPSNGFLLKTTNYEILGTIIGECMKILTSMGKLGGEKWLEKNKYKIKFKKEEDK